MKDKEIMKGKRMEKIVLSILLFVGVLGTIWTTLGYTQGWIDQGDTTLTREELFGVHFINQDEGWVVGNYGTIIHTTDRGVNWSRQVSNTTLDLHDVKFVNSDLGWAVGVGGKILRTTDGGATWIDESDPQVTTAWLWRCSFPDTLHGWAVGQNGTIIHTTDGGRTWAKQDLSHLPGWSLWELKGVFFRDSLEGWVCGKEGIILHTADGGDYWQRQWEDGTRMNLNGIVFPENELEGWAGGKWGEIIHTTDGGESWEKQIEGVQEIPECLMGGVYMIDNKIGWGVGKYGRIVSTYDGGAFTHYDTLGRPTYGEYPDSGWVIEVERSELPWRNLRGLHAVKQSNQVYVWAVGQLGTVLHKELEVSVDEELAAGLPKTFSLAQNFPNPFNSGTTINYETPKAGYVNLKIYNIMGQEVRTLVDSFQEADFYTVHWNGEDNRSNDVSNGIYFCKLVLSLMGEVETGEFTATKRLVVIR